MGPREFACVRHTTQYGRDDLQSNLLEALRNSLENLNNLRLIPPNDPYVLDLKRHLRDKIADLEDDENYETGGHPENQPDIRSGDTNHLR